MEPKKILKFIAYGLSVFVIYILIVTIIRLISKNIPEETILFDFYTQKDLLFGLIIALMLSISNLTRKKR